MSLAPRPLFLALIPGEAAQIEPPEAWLAAARQGLATTEALAALEAAVAALGARIVTLEAGRNISVTAGENGVLRIEAIGQAIAYRTVSAGRALAADDDGRVLEADRAVTLTVPAELPRGFCCLIRQVGAEAVRVARGPGVRFVPENRDLQTAGPWAEVTLEARGGGVVLARAIAP